MFETGEVLQFPLPKAVPPDWCAYINSVQPILDIETFLVRQVDARPNGVLSEKEVQTIGKRCLSKVAAYARKYASLYPLIPFLGKKIFRAGIVSYDAKHKTGSFGSFLISVDHREPER